MGSAKKNEGGSKDSTSKRRSQRVRNQKKRLIEAPKLETTPRVKRRKVQKAKSSQKENDSSIEDGVAMWSTRPRSAALRTWVGFLKSRSFNKNEWYCFSDGSSTGWHAAVIVPPNRKNVSCFTKWIDHEGARNVATEAAAYLLALENIPKECKKFTNISDFLFVGAHDTGNRNAKNVLIKKIYTRAKNIRTKAKIKVKHIHHAGHQKDKSDFTQFNHLVDHLAGLKKEVACRIPFKKVAKLVSAPKEFEMNIEEYHDVSAGL